MNTEFLFPFPEYDRDNNVVETQIADFEGTKFKLSVSFTRDAIGRIKFIHGQKRCASAHPDFKLSTCGTFIEGTAVLVNDCNQGPKSGVCITPKDKGNPNETYLRFEELVSRVADFWNCAVPGCKSHVVQRVAILGCDNALSSEFRLRMALCEEHANDREAALDGAEAYYQRHRKKMPARDKISFAKIPS